MALSSQNALPEPALDLSRIPPSTSWFVPPLNYYRQTIGQPVRPTPPSYSSDDPWNTNPQTGVLSSNPFDSLRGGSANGAPSNLAGTGLPSGWWKKQETARVNILGPQGFILNRYMVYEIVTDVSQIFRCVLTLLTWTSAERPSRSSTILRVCVFVGLFDAAIPIPFVPSFATETDWA